MALALPIYFFFPFAGDIASYCGGSGTLWVHTINGILLASINVEPIDAFIFDKSGKWLITGSHNGMHNAVEIM